MNQKGSPQASSELPCLWRQLEATLDEKWTIAEIMSTLWCASHRQASCCDRYFDGCAAFILLGGGLYSS